MIERIISKFKNKQRDIIPVTQTTPSDNKYVCIEYSHMIQNGLKKSLGKHGLKLAFRTTNKTKQTLSVNSTKDNIHKSGVYRITCADCPNFYVGQTGRSFNQRYKEHRPNSKADYQKSTFAQHLVDKNHTMAEMTDGLQILHVCRKGSKLDSLEQFEIYKSFTDRDGKDNILNEKLKFKSHSIFNAIISHNTRQKSDNYCPADNKRGGEGVT